MRQLWEFVLLLSTLIDWLLIIHLINLLVPSLRRFCPFFSYPAIQEKPCRKHIMKPHLNHQDTRKESLPIGTPGTSISLVERDLLLEVRQSWAEGSGYGLSCQESTDERWDERALMGQGNGNDWVISLGESSLPCRDCVISLKFRSGKMANKSLN